MNDALTDLHERGYAILEGVLGDNDLVEARRRLAEIALAEQEDGTAILEDGAAADGVYRPGVNQRVVALLGKHVVFQRLATCAPVLTLARRLFAESYGSANAVAELGLDEALLSSITANIARRGGKEMTLHADQGFVPPSTPYPVLVNVVWPLVDFTSRNGATRVIPGSHVDPAADPRAAIAVEAPAGSAIVMDGRVLHGTGANTTEEPRSAILANYCRPWVRPFANHLLDLGPTAVSSVSAELLALLGHQRWFVYGFSEQHYVARLRN